jgi:membrane fusion protein (multidrug efflux system)
MRVGQPATLTADLYGSKVTYHGTIAGFGAGTGSAFALLPAQNATGNWIKIVQRVPVRIALDRRELAAHPLQIGLSMQVEVATKHREGERLPQVSLPTAAYAASMSDGADRAAAERVRAIIAANDRGEATRSPAGAATQPEARSRVASTVVPAGAPAATAGRL